MKDINRITASSEAPEIPPTNKSAEFIRGLAGKARGLLGSMFGKKDTAENPPTEEIIIDPDTAAKIVSDIMKERFGKHAKEMDVKSVLKAYSDVKQSSAKKGLDFKKQDLLELVGEIAPKAYGQEIADQIETRGNEELLESLDDATVETQKNAETVAKQLHFQQIKRRQQTIRNKNEHVGRNDACPCGSGKKFKNCCMGKENEKRKTKNEE